MQLRDLIKEERKIFHWLVFSSKNEPLIKTNKQTLLKLCLSNKELQKPIDDIIDKDDKTSLIIVRLKS